MLLSARINPEADYMLSEKDVIPPISTGVPLIPAAPEVIRSTKEKSSINAKKEKVLRGPRIVFENGHLKSVTSLTTLFANKNSHGNNAYRAPIVVSGGEDKKIIFWSIETGSQLFTLEGHSSRVSSLSVCYPDNETIALISASWDESVKVWDVSKIFMETNDKSITKSFADAVAKSVTVLRGHKNRVSAVDCLDSSSLSRLNNSHVMEGSIVATCACDNTIRIWSVKANRSHVEGKEGNSCRFDVNFLFKLYDSKMTWWLCLKLCDSVQFGPVAVTGGKDHSLRVWSLNKSLEDSQSHSSSPSEPLKVISGHESRVLALEIYEESSTNFVVTICKDLFIRLWDLHTGELIRTLEGHTSSINALSIYRYVTNEGDSRSTNTYIVSAGANGNIRLWNTSGEVLRMFSGHTDQAVALATFQSPDNPDQWIVISGSMDKTVRTWLFAEEKSITVLEHSSMNTNSKDTNAPSSKKRVKILSIDVYAEDTDARPIIVTGCDDSTIRVWTLSRTTQTGEIKWIKKVHDGKSGVSRVAVYIPPPNYVFDKTKGKLNLCVPLIVSASEDGTICLTNLSNGNPISKIPWQGHPELVTSLTVFPGFYIPENPSGNIEAFIVSGSEDNNVHVWPLSQDVSEESSPSFQQLLFHEFNITDVLVYFSPPNVDVDILNANKLSNSPRVSRSESRPDSAGSLNSISKGSRPSSGFASKSPIIITSCMGNYIAFWSCGDCSLLCSIGPLNTHISSLAMFSGRASAQDQINSDTALLLAGGGDGSISLYVVSEDKKDEFNGVTTTYLRTLEGHKDEVRTMRTYSSVGRDPVLVSGSWDTTLIVWSLNTFKRIKTIEGHKNEVTGLSLFHPGGVDVAVASSSTDGRVRVCYDFLGKMPKSDFIDELYKFDSRQLGPKRTKWTRLSEVVEEYGADPFFTSYYSLFLRALDMKRPDFIAHFLPKTIVGLRKTNVENSLLQRSLSTGSVTASKVINSCWIKFLTHSIQDDTDAIYSEPEINLLQTQDLLALAETSPVEFERLICSIKSQPAKKNAPFERKVIYFHEATGEIRLFQSENASLKHSENNDEDAAHSEVTELFYWLPVINPFSREMMLAYCKTCVDLGSVEIFNSEVGQLSLSYAWLNYGRYAYTKSMIIYLVYVVIVSIANYTATIYMDDTASKGRKAEVYALVFLDLIFSLYLSYEEILTLLKNKSFFAYVSDIWSQLTIVLLSGNITGCIIRLVEGKETQASRAILSVAIIPTYFYILYFLRAFELSGPLVSMVLRIAKDMIPFTLVLFIVILGYSQSLWLLSFQQIGYAFATIQDSLLNSFNFMLGGFDPTAFDGLPLKSLSIFLIVIYMVFVNLLLLNLLIALMGDSYAAVREKGIAQWKLEQAQLIIEQDCLPPYNSDRNGNNPPPLWIYVLKNIDSVQSNIPAIENSEESDVSKAIMENMRSMIQEEMQKLRDDILLNK